jgi:hypothetical protein
MPVRARNLEVDRKPLQLRVREEDAELLAHQPLADVVVAIAIRA